MTPRSQDHGAGNKGQHNSQPKRKQKMVEVGLRGKIAGNERKDVHFGYCVHDCVMNRNSHLHE